MSQRDLAHLIFLSDFLCNFVALVNQEVVCAAALLSPLSSAQLSINAISNKTISIIVTNAQQSFPDFHFHFPLFQDQAFTIRKKSCSIVKGTIAPFYGTIGMSLFHYFAKFLSIISTTGVLTKMAFSSLPVRALPVPETKIQGHFAIETYP